MFVSLLLQAVAALLTFLVVYNFYWKRRNLPPGPVPLPLVGNVLELAKNEAWEETFLRWKKRYGDIYTYWLSELPVVAVNDYAKMVELFQKDGDAYAGREHSEVMDVYLKGGTSGVIMAENELWREQRRFALHVLRDFGLGKGIMQERVLNEVTALIGKVHKDASREGKECDLPSRLDISIGSVINALLFGYRWDEDKAEEFLELKKLVADVMKTVGGPMINLIANFPGIFMRLPMFAKYAEDLKKKTDALFAFYRRQIADHEKHIDFATDSQALDYAEAFLREKAKRENEGGDHHYTYRQLEGMCSDLFIAGQETTSTTLAWGFTYLVLNPDAQAKIHEELDAVIGSDRLITMDDRPLLNYTNAAISEIQRLCNLLPQNLLHRTTKDVVVDGYRLPKGTCIVPQISTVHYDEQVFPNPKRFDPSRYLDAKGIFKPSAQVMPFSIGKRQCLGEGLARMELFLFLANLLNQFKFTPGSKPPSMKRSLGLTVACPPFTTLVEKRH